MTRTLCLVFNKEIGKDEDEKEFLSNILNDLSEELDYLKVQNSELIVEGLINIDFTIAPYAETHSYAAKSHDFWEKRGEGKNRKIWSITYYPRKQTNHKDKLIQEIFEKFCKLSEPEFAYCDVGHDDFINEKVGLSRNFSGKENAGKPWLEYYPEKTHVEETSFEKNEEQIERKNLEKGFIIIRN